ncbi:hypothetical protein I5677_01905 [Mobilitalea sibirica]|uniref:Uncharacterized protein n=1 Tax=Mobilitalea sibirica TaxID=1462919 RepID=A0A8J7H104_9FIRM|nr:hypothetical protein [Mobilitalea sibirica]MBH1939645.1 hypothetical protein [Mobilitalea sibirica]
MKKEIIKEIENGHLLKKYGSWMYCDGCNQTVGYLCYTTYSYFNLKYKCKCGNEGCFKLWNKNNLETKINGDNLIKIKNRLCCPSDKSPLFSIVENRLERYEYQVICQECNTEYKSSH